MGDSKRGYMSLDANHMLPALYAPLGVTSLLAQRTNAERAVLLPNDSAPDACSSLGGGLTMNPRWPFHSASTVWGKSLLCVHLGARKKETEGACGTTGTECILQQNG